MKRILGVFVCSLSLLLLNGRSEWVGQARNRWASWGVLLATLGFFGVLLVKKLLALLG